ncbi:MAG: hypothetical protein AAGC96_04330 [Pseudomonadota bacterium]
MPNVFQPSKMVAGHQTLIRRVSTWLLACMFVVVPAVASEDTGAPAFPGATGFGKYSNGWRGGAIVPVTTLDDNGPGSLRSCAEKFIGPRVCVFKVSGTIKVDKSILVTPNTYIAGQTAPGKGVQIRLGAAQGAPVVMHNSRDVLIRFLKLRPGPSRKPSPSVDAILIENSQNIYLDHLSLQFATDENVGIHFSRLPTRDITIARSIIALGLDKSNHPKGRHSKGALICSSGGDDPECGRISLIENLFAHNRDRNPNIYATAVGPVEVFNNVFYNAKSQFGEFYNLIGDTRVNYAGNVVLPGPSSRKDPPLPAVEGFDWKEEFVLEIYAEDNVNQTRKGCGAPSDNLILDGEAAAHRMPEPVMPVAHKPYPSSQTYESVLAIAGSRTPDGRFDDTLDDIVVKQVRSCKGRITNRPESIGGWPDLPEEVAAPDADNDGMPDAWELARGLDPNDAADTWGDINGNGWSNIEEYLSELAGDFREED